ncbi:MAG: hypothetical protein KA184_05130 [Candidatus Hydrogenedentes bacterium]|nr:hypothetical protein [Candidatus Hydrogenedentota bacterium]
MSSDSERFLGVDDRSGGAPMYEASGPTPLSGTLYVLGVIGILAGVIAFLYLLASFGEAGMFSSRGEVTGGELLAALGVGLYFVTVGTMCLGIARVLDVVHGHKAISAISLSPPAAPAYTICPHCQRQYSGNLRGQFCEMCGKQM